WQFWQLQLWQEERSAIEIPGTNSPQEVINSVLAWTHRGTGFCHIEPVESLSELIYVLGFAPYDALIDEPCSGGSRRAMKNDVGERFAFGKLHRGLKKSITQK